MPDRTIRSACLNWLLILNRHLERVLRVYVDRFNRERPNRARDLAGGLIHESYRAAA